MQKQTHQIRRAGKRCAYLFAHNSFERGAGDYLCKRTHAHGRRTPASLRSLDRSIFDLPQNDRLNAHPLGTLPVSLPEFIWPCVRAGRVAARAVNSILYISSCTEHTHTQTHVHVWLHAKLVHDMTAAVVARFDLSHSTTGTRYSLRCACAHSRACEAG